MPLAVRLADGIRTLDRVPAVLVGTGSPGKVGCSRGKIMDLNWSLAVKARSRWFTK